MPVSPPRQPARSRRTAAGLAARRAHRARLGRREAWPSAAASRAACSPPLRLGQHRQPLARPSTVTRRQGFAVAGLGARPALRLRARRKRAAPRPPPCARRQLLPQRLLRSGGGKRLQLRRAALPSALDLGPSARTSAPAGPVPRPRLLRQHQPGRAPSRLGQPGEQAVAGRRASASARRASAAAAPAAASCASLAARSAHRRRASPALRRALGAAARPASPRACGPRPPPAPAAAARPPLPRLRSATRTGSAADSSRASARRSRRRIGSTLPVIGMSRKPAGGAVQLLGQHGAGQEVRPGRRTEAQQQVGAARSASEWPSAAPIRKRHSRLPRRASVEPLGEVARGQRLAPLVEQHGDRGR
jgi:hypothetical protein